MFGYWSKCCDWQEQERADDNDRAEQEAAESKCVVAQRPQTEGGAFLHSQETSERYWRDDRDETAEQDDEGGRDIQGTASGAGLALWFRP
jgi:hypothetical protein